MNNTEDIILIPYKSINHDPNAEEIPIVINKCHGGFGLSELAKKILDLDFDKLDICEYEMDRTDLALVKVVEKLGIEANSKYSNLVIVKIPKKCYDHNAWDIDEYDGYERLILDMDKANLCEELLSYKTKITEYEQIINFYEKSLELHPDGKKIMELKEHFMLMANKTNK